MKLEVENLSAWYGQALALNSVSLSVEKGQVVGILGHNGAGKTTLVRCIAGLHDQCRGQVRFDGTSLEKLRPSERALLGLTLLREGGRLPASLTVTQNLILGQRLARARGHTPRELNRIWEWFPILEPLQGRKAGLLSGGQRQALALAVTFVSEPSLILLDEPSAGLAPPVARELFSLIARLAATGLPTLVVEQHPGWLNGLTNDVYLLEVGEIAAHGPIEKLLPSLEKSGA
ncbi:MAG: ATP-binding cassette domain-containing protein [Xanthobacteraceae bacterium]